MNIRGILRGLSAALACAVMLTGFPVQGYAETGGSEIFVEAEEAFSTPTSINPEPGHEVMALARETNLGTVEDLRGASGYAEGDTVTTAGFYTAGDGGGASYTVGTKAANEPLVIAMSNGLTAELVIEEEMSVLQFGAANDGETDSKPALQAALDSDASVLTFPEDGELMIRSGLVADTSKSLEGNGCTLLTDSGYQGSVTNFFLIRGVSGFEWDSLNIKGTAELSRYITLEGNASGVVIEGSTFDVQTDRLFFLHSTGGDISIRDNEIQFQVTDTVINGKVFTRNMPEASPADVYNNSITVDNTGLGRSDTLFHGNINARDNDITINGNITQVFTKLPNVEGNTVTVNGDMEEFIRDCILVSGNTVSVDGAVGTVFRYHATNFTGIAVLSSNIVTASVPYSSNSFVMMATNITLNGNRIELYDNIISMPPKSGYPKDFIYNINTLDAGTPVKTYKGYYEEIDVSDLENVVYINASNVFSGSIIETYLRGGVEVISHNAAPNPAASGGTGNVLYISPDNRFSESLTGTYRRGNVRVIG